MTRACRLRIVRRSREATTEPVPVRREAQAEVVPQEEVSTTGGEPGGEVIAQAEELAATAGEA